MAIKYANTPAHLRVSHYNKTTTPIIPITAATTATPAGFSAPLLALTVAEGDVTEVVGDPVAVVIGGTVAVLVADEIDAVPVPDACDVVPFAEAVTKPELSVALGVDVGATVVFEVEVEGAA